MSLQMTSHQRLTDPTVPAAIGRDRPASAMRSPATDDLPAQHPSADIAAPAGGPEAEADQHGAAHRAVFGRRDDIVGTAFGCGDGDDGEGQGKSCPEALRDVLDKPEEEVILLYPGDTALPLQERDAALNRASVVEDTPIDERRTTTLVVIDGTWAQTQAIYQQSPTLQRLPQCMFDDDTASLFDSIRQEPASHCTSTLEAISRALRIVAGGSSKEGDDWNNAAFVAADALEDSLRAMVKGQVQYATDASKSRPRTKNNCDDNASTAKGRKAALGRKIRRRRQAQLSLPKPLSEEEIEARRIRFIYVAHLG
eukprot:CAMPEP_0181043238 /NCGR_PEP_ID=MMETSP1070-20121207/12597_1 /TAXON_ID=265543 /ORGANISM="Minutocellus polymorphus, Strain NH13" /LENGTH=310 /DNA_ID=CAMNT_0023121545 /DNA_START=330 /DNA_END=1264 /DNA_ORIENTATION=-